MGVGVEKRRLSNGELYAGSHRLVLMLALTFAPCVLSFAPCVLTFAPCILSLAPCTLTFAPCVLTFAPCVLACAPCTLTFAPCILTFAPCACGVSFLSAGSNILLHTRWLTSVATCACGALSPSHQRRYIVHLHITPLQLMLVVLLHPATGAITLLALRQLALCGGSLVVATVCGGGLIIAMRQWLFI